MKHSEQLFEDSTFCYMEQLFRLAYSRIGNPQDAEDIVQDTYLKAWRAFSSIRQRESIKSWITHILINTIRDYRRKEMRTVQTVDISALEEDSLHEPRQDSPEEAICRDEIDPALLRALRSIPETFLTPLLLREINESTYEEIAHTLDIPIGTVMSRLFRARSLLRKALLPEIHPDSTAVTPQSDEYEEDHKRGLPNEMR
jgi:RNA polymerase sigma-70 factor, ECF subfamily